MFNTSDFSTKQFSCSNKFTNIIGMLYLKMFIFRLDAVALSVIATATCLAGWLGVRHTPVLYQNG